MAEANSFQVPNGSIYVTTFGSIMAETVQSLVATARYMEQLGLKNVDVRFTQGTLVDKARNEAAKEMLVSGAQWLWFIDADMQWHPTMLDAMLQAAFRDALWADIVGGYCQLRGAPFLPTIDTGTGTWEVHEPGKGILEVIRTGGACMLVRRHVFERLEYPWYGVRPAPRPLDVMAELDNFARIKFDGRNPFMELPAWNELLGCAKDEATQQRVQAGANARMDLLPSTVGEDSNFCDKARAAGFRIAVQTNAVCNHIDRKIITPADHAEAIKNILRSEDQAAGVLG